MVIVVVVCGKICGKIEKLSDWNKKMCGSKYGPPDYDKETKIQKYKTAKIQKEKKTNSQKGKKTKRQKGKKAKIQKDRQTERQKDKKYKQEKKTNRQKD